MRRARLAAAVRGYVSVATRAAASLSCLLPPTWIPFAFAIVATATMLLPAWELTGERWRAIAPWRVRSVLVLALAWLPLANFALQGTLMYAQWALLWWGCLLLLRPRVSADRAGSLATFGVTAAVVSVTWSHPLGVVLAPIALVRVVRSVGAARVVACAWLLGSASCLLLATPTGAPMRVAPIEFGTYVLVRLGFDCAFSPAAKHALWNGGHAWLAVLGGGLALAAVVWLVLRAWPRWSPAARTFVLGCCWCAATTLAASFLTRSEMMLPEDVHGVRYVWIARQCLVVVVVLACATCFGTLRTTAVVVGWSLLLLPLQRQYYRCPHGRAGLDEFLQRRGAEERAASGRAGITATLPRNGWPIELRSRR